MLSINNLFEVKKEKDTNDHWFRSNIKIKSKVLVIKKEDQRSGELTKGTVEKILTNKQKHTRGIKVRLKNGDVGRVQKIIK